MSYVSPCQLPLAAMPGVCARPLAHMLFEGVLRRICHRGIQHLQLDEEHAHSIELIDVIPP